MRRARPPTVSTSPPWPTRRTWNSTDQIPQRAVDDGSIGRFGTIDPTDGGESQPLQPVGGVAAVGRDDSSRAASLYAIRSKLEPVLELHLLPRRSGERRPVRAGREARVVFGGDASQTWLMHWGERHDAGTRSACSCAATGSSPVGLYNSAARQRLSTTREDQVTVGKRRAVRVQNAIEWSTWFRTIAGLRADYFRFDVVERQPRELGQGERHDRLAEAVDRSSDRGRTPSTSSTGGRDSTATTRAAPRSRSIPRPASRRERGRSAGAHRRATRLGLRTPDPAER